jgi:hypothetical protein
MWTFIAVISFLGIFAFLILGIVNAFRKTGKAKKIFLYMAGCFVLMILASTQINTSEKASTTENKNVVPSNKTAKEEDKTTPQKNVSSQKVSKTAVKKTVKTQKKTYGIGDVVKVGKLQYTVHTVSETNTIKSNNEFIPSVVTKGKFVLITYTVVNLDKTARTIDSSMFKLKGNGSEFDPSNGGNIDEILGDKNLFLQDINPQMSRDGELVYEVPTNLVHYSLEVAPGYGFKDLLTENKTIILK